MSQRPARPFARALTVASCALLMALTACDGTADEVSGSSLETSTQAVTPQPGSTSGTPEPASDPPVVADVPTKPASEVETTPAEQETAPAEPSPEQCLVGEWLADNDYFLSLMQELGDEVDGVTGSVILTFSADGTMLTHYQDWLITAFSDGEQVTIHRDGLDDGEFSVEGGQLSLRDTTVGSVTTVSAAGFEMVVEPEPALQTSVDFTCSPDTAAVSTPDGELKLSRLG